MGLGPVEVLAIKFPGNQFKGEIIPAIGRLVEQNIIRVIDIVLIHKNKGDDVRIIELNDLDDDDYQTFDPIVSEITGMLSQGDIHELSKLLDDNSSAGFMAFEHTWARGFRDAVLGAKGELIFSERIPAAAVEEALAKVGSGD
ncbi:MAG TPA: DUF6325 family protein [Dehalococcoidia bacterium]|nr:DUF6325 family protein [Dehalococcoidia bacterium]